MLEQKNNISKSKFTNTAKMTSAAALILAISSPSIVAQEVNEALEARKKEQSVEVIEVTGVRSSLESALLTKRSASSVVDAISATDIDALPALDLGEALQALPGVQLNSESEGRESSISLRGLSSGFVKTTAYGQTFASPTRSGGGVIGSAAPFSVFEAGVFDGVTVVKSPTADLQEGGIAGVVDKKLQQALSKKDGIATVSLGVQYEELAEAANPELKLSGVKHLIDDKLAVAFKFSHSKQEFRRDTFDIIDYVDVYNQDPDLAANKRIGGDTGIERATNEKEYREKYGIPADSILRVPLRGRNVTQYSEGDRNSFSGNIEYRPIENMKLGAHILLSKRALDDGTKETTNFEAGLNKRNAANDFYLGEVTLDMDAAPFAYTGAKEGSTAQAFIAPSISFENGKLQNENRKTTFFSESNGIILYGDYATDNWLYDGVITYSKAKNEFTNIGLGYNHQGNKNPAQTPSGFNGKIHTGYGDLDSIRVSGGLEVPYVYDGVWPDAPLAVTENGLSTLADVNQGRRLSTYINGRTRDQHSDMSSVEFNAERFLDIGFGDGFRLDTVKFGGRYQAETVESIDQVHGLGGVNLNNLSSEFISNNPLSAQQTPFFNGNIPGTFDHTNGWATVDYDKTIAALQTGLVTDRDQVPLGSLAELHPSTQLNRVGFWDRARKPNGQAWLLDSNFDVQQDLTAFYITTDFSGELPLDIAYSGNLGVRHVITDNEFDGVQTTQDEAGETTFTPLNFKDSYSNTLPMLNVAFELTEDIQLRTAWYQAIARPNVTSQLPAATYTAGNNSVKLVKPSASLDPYVADNIDLSLEWYNREGSAISIGYFRKDITDLFVKDDEYCPEDGSDQLVNDNIGEIQDLGQGNCIQVAEYTPPPTGVPGEIPPEPRQREVNIEEWTNSDDKLKVEGVEVAIQQNLSFLSYPWNGFGGVVNYTNIKQSGSENLLSRVSPQSANIIGYYENDGVSLRFAYNWRDDQTASGSNGFLGTGKRVIKAKGRLDFSANYKVTKNVKVYFQAINITDSITTSYYGYNDNALHQLTYTGRIYKAAVSYKF